MVNKQIKPLTPILYCSAWLIVESRRVNG